jgi:ABC-type spermidine/putrescine transport system permease subunit I
MNAAWHRFLLPPLLITLLLLVGSQAVFLHASFYKDLGFGVQANTPSFANYQRMLGDPFYLGVLWTSVVLSAIASAWTVGLGFPTAYILARARSRWAPAMLALILLSAFVTTRHGAMCAAAPRYVPPPLLPGCAEW